MLALLIRKELLDHLLSLRFAMACIICPVVILSSVFILARDYHGAAQDYHTNLIMHADQLAQIRQPHNLTIAGVMVDKPLNPMKVFFSGTNEQHTATARIGGFGAPEVQPDFDKNPVSLLFPIMDLTFVAGVIMSLLAIAFSYDAFSGEKELGTLAVVMSYPVPRDLLLFGKWVGGCIALMVPFILSVLMGLTLTLLFPEIDLRAADWTSLALAVGGVLVYLSTIYALGLFVSARTSMASTSITVLLLIWVVLILIIPNLSPYIAGLMRQTPSMQSIESQKSELQASEMGKFMSDWRAYIVPAQQNNTPVEEILAKYKELETDMRERVKDGTSRIDAEFQRAMDGQVSLARSIATVSPAAVFTLAVTDFAGTGVREEAGFRSSLQHYADQYMNWRRCGRLCKGYRHQSWG